MSLNSDAQRVAKHFIGSTEQRATPAIMKKTTSQAKSILQSGYTKEEIIEVIDYLINIKQVNIYSLGYINKSINDVLRQIKQNNKEKEKQELKSQIEQEQANREQQTGEVKSDYESAERNQGKAGKLGVKPRFGEESFSDLFEGK